MYFMLFNIVRAWENQHIKVQIHSFAYVLFGLGIHSAIGFTLLIPLEEMLVGIHRLLPIGLIVVSWPIMVAILWKRDKTKH
jgi:hypothetical protein